jgi:pimeloyl-ACP methyl ester carboxylesterase
MSARTNWCIAAVAIVCFTIGVTLSHQVESGVRVESVTLAGDIPALEFSPADLNPHPVAMLVHGYTGSKENLFFYGEALAAAGFKCFAVDLPGHGMSLQSYSRDYIFHKPTKNDENQ